VLISQATQILIEDEEEGEPGFTLVDVGEYRLKDLDRPVRLFQLAAAGLVAPPLPGGGRLAAGHPGGPGPVLAAPQAGSSGRDIPPKQANSRAHGTPPPVRPTPACRLFWRWSPGRRPLGHRASGERPFA
jgi:hypothetical protein